MKLVPKNKVESSKTGKLVKSKPTLRIKRKEHSLLDDIFIPETSYTGDWKNSFPLMPTIKKSEIIETEKQLKALSEALLKVDEFSFDTETNGLKCYGPNREFKVVGISISWGEYNNYYIPMGHLRDEDLERQLDTHIVTKYLRKPFRRRDVRIIGHNLKFDLHVIARLNIKIRTRDIFDTMLASWLCDENSANGLKECSMFLMGIKQTHFKEATATVPNEIKKKFGYKSNSKVLFDLVLIDVGAPYAIDDAFYTHMLYLGFKELLKIEKMDKIYYNKFVPFLFALFDMEERGVLVDKTRLEQMGKEMQIDLDELQYKIFEISGVEFNINSSQQKAEILFGWQKPDTTFADLKGKRRDSYIKKNGKKPSDFIVSYAKRNYNLIDNSFGFVCKSFTDNGAPATDADAIWSICNLSFKTNKRKQAGVEMCKLIAKYAKLSKLKSAFVDGMLEQIYDDGKVHPNFKQTGTDSGRISCSTPNLQQLPKANEDDKYQIRSVFIGSQYVEDADGHYVGDLLDLGCCTNDNYEIKNMDIIALDYHNLEMVCLTYFSKDANLTKMFANDEDAHGSTAVNMFNLECDSTEVKKLYNHLRQAAKVINFMLMYGGGAKSLYESLKTDQISPLDLGSPEYLKLYKCKNGKEVAQVFIDKYFSSYKGVAKFITDQKKYAHKHGFVWTILGRKRRLPDINSRDNATASYNERLAVNSAIQGTAGDITSSAQIRISLDERLKEMHCHMLIQVHDELVFECPEEHTKEAIEIIKQYMEHPFGEKADRQIPFLRADYDTGKTYQDAK